MNGGVFNETNKLQKELGRRCRALLNTPKWNEAYGNVVVEALACGVPVIAYRKGVDLVEIIQHGETGFLGNRATDRKGSTFLFEVLLIEIERKKL